ncbi:MAG: hypothetical protein Q9195_004728 [Heterodermia aff. obscurata]
MERFRRRVSADENISRLERAISGFTVSRRPSPVRQASSEDERVEDSFKGPLGLNLLRDVTEPLIDFIFVHGLGGGSRKTWSKSSNQYHYWPKEWLSQDPEFGCVRVWSFGYKADWNERKETVLEIQDFALALVGEIENAPDIRRSKTKIVFVAHSMGGLVVKQACILAREDPSLGNLAGRIHTLYFLATPHRGSDLTKTLTNILKVSYGQKAFVSDLEPNSSLINATNDSFRHHAEDLQLWSFYETFPSQILLTNALIVNKSSATLGYARERISPLNSDHRGVCKFDLPSDPNYKTLRNAFITTIDTILSQSKKTHLFDQKLCSLIAVSQITSETIRLQHDKLAALIGLSEPPVNDLAALEDVRIPNSCEWLISKPAYSTWHTPWSDSPPVFWLLGNAGSGKSVLCSHVIREMQKDNLRCSYFFFKHGTDVKSSIAGCLRALAYQMAKSDEAILRKVLELEQDTVPCVQWDEGTTWRKLFMGCIFKLSKPLPQFWVIDALDESPKFSTFLKLIKDLPSYMRIFLTSRGTPEAQQGLVSLGPLVESYQVQSEDILDDLGILIDSKMSQLPVSDGDGQLKLRDKLLSKSSGSFLWVSLIIQELEQTYSEEDAEEILNEVPEDMNQLYIRMLNSLPSSDRATRLTHCVFLWTLLTRRALTLSEMQCAIKLDLNQTIHNLGRSLPAICGQFMSIDRSNCIQSIHQTAHVFLLSQDDVPPFAVDEQSGHNRIAQTCLKFLNGNQLRDTYLHRQKNGPQSSTSGTELLDYACTSFSHHVQKSVPDDDNTFSLLRTFLETRIPPWIEYLATKAEMYHVIRTVKNLQSYMKRRVKQMSPLSSGKDMLESWIKDLVKVNAKFRTHLSISPSAIHNLIPALCPLDSMMSKKYAPRNRGFVVEGLKETTWDDCVAMIDFQDKQACAIALGDQYLAVALSQGPVYVYYRDSIHVKHTLAFGERAKTLVLSSDCGYLAACGLRKATIWDTDSGAQIWTFSRTHAALSTAFDIETNNLVTATQGGYISTWDLREGRETDHWEWNESVNATRGMPKPNRSPGKVLLSPDSCTLAACYRGLPIYLFDVKAKTCIGCCQRKVESKGQMRGNQYLVDALAFNPNIEIDVLVASYGDGELAVFNKTSNDLRHCVPNIFAQTLACSSDGSILVTGSSRGLIRMFEFGGIEGDRLSLVYRINSYDDAIRSIAFGGDSSHFAVICGSHCRLWGPAVLAQNHVDGGSQSEFSQGSTFVFEPKGSEEGSEEAGITAICGDEAGNWAFCGKLDGAVALFETQSAAQRAVLYRHALHIRVTSIAYHERGSLLMTADESGRILIYKLSLEKDVVEDDEVASLVSDVSTEVSIQKLLPDPAGNGILVISRGFATMRTLAGEQKGSPIGLTDKNGDKIALLHPTRPQNFIVLGSDNVDVYSWSNVVKEDPLIHDHLGGLSLTVTPPTPLLPSFPENSSQSTSPVAATVPTKYIAHLSSPPFSPHSLRIWPAELLSGTTSSSPPPQPYPDPNHLGSKMRQIIAVWETRLLFLDIHLWVCSLELSSRELLVVKRHFFLLPEWLGTESSFNVLFSEAKREIWIGFRGRLLVVKKGLDWGELWSLG